VDVLSGWQNSVGKHVNSFAWKLAPLCLMRAELKKRKNHTFIGVDMSIVELKYS
jgi:hypothetical protein